MVVEVGEEEDEEIEDTEMEAENDGTEEEEEVVVEVRGDTVPTLTRTEEEVDNATDLLHT